MCTRSTKRDTKKDARHVEPKCKSRPPIRGLSVCKWSVRRRKRVEREERTEQMRNGLAQESGRKESQGRDGNRQQEWSPGSQRKKEMNWHATC